jgi:hypothetical protein
LRETASVADSQRYDLKEQMLKIEAQQDAAQTQLDERDKRVRGIQERMDLAIKTHCIEWA